MLYVSVLVYGENIFFAKMLQNPHTRKALVQFNSEMGLTWLIASFWGSFFVHTNGEKAYHNVKYYHYIHMAQQKKAHAQL